MKQYLLSVYQPDGDPPPPETLEPIMRDLDALREEMKAAGVWAIVKAPDLDAALDWGGRLARAIGLLPIEVRPFQGEAED
ncbi:MAG: hypothetical protein AUI14_25290 [Actinobacteria bacterium 13_2_20CM_2_71_6]|nr:MAG: hypothetical protein AUI14_25290 [Actinobacteria bacterium 13_2_20CM_2_71_6]